MKPSRIIMYNVIIYAVKAKIPVQDVPVNSQASSSSSSSAGDQLKGTPSSTYGHKESKPLSSAGGYV